MTSWLKKVICRLIGHRFKVFEDGYKRRCSRCAREDWMMSNPYPKIGEVKYYWKHMDWERPF